VVGDEILKSVARLLQDNVRETDIVARYGGDEFVILMPNTSEDQAKMVRERIEHAALLYHDKELDPRKQFRISLGLRSATALNVDNILIEADRAMYKGRELHVKQSLLHALIANDASEVERWDRFIANILKILAEKEPHFHNHSRRVMNYSVHICQIIGLESYFLEIISIAALLHDIGKISISSDLLRSASPLTQEEYDIIKTHPVMGVDLMKAADYLKEVREIIFSHHERWDGKTNGSFPGYPQGLSGDTIPLGARILKLADSYDAMTSLRPYAQPLNPDEAIRILLDEQGHSFDPQIVKVFVPYLRTITSSLSGPFPV
jgi:putative nucleotidyltransferase with HDIG domain